jgi:hypothetical protein
MTWMAFLGKVDPCTLVAYLGHLHDLDGISREGRSLHTCSKHISATDVISADQVFGRICEVNFLLGSNVDEL